MDPLEYLVKNPKGKIEDLKKEMSEEDIKGYALTGHINITKEDYKINQCCIDEYKAFYSEPTLWEKIMGLFCHYILRY